MILVDRHQADLLYAIQRLFDDRLGIGVYIPLGYEWWEEGYWRFGECFGDRRLADQYLQISDGVHRPAGPTGVYVTFDTAHPERPIYGLTLEAFWRYADDSDDLFVMPSVQENQRGYKRLADETGARYLYQVGNVGQQIDWDLDPLLISTTSAPITGRGVQVRQEIDSGPGETYGWSPPIETRVVRNAVNSLNRLPGYADFLALEEALAPEGFAFTIHGHEGRDGDINPVDALAELMRSSGWGFHDKPVGDGFGHVIHAWAAVGRPLIGHASYYSGCLAEGFWQDGVTCVDLNRHSLAETTALVREISADRERHLSMCRAIRAEFDSVTDYERDASAVRALLEL